MDRGSTNISLFKLALIVGGGLGLVAAMCSLLVLAGESANGNSSAKPQTMQRYICSSSANTPTFSLTIAASGGGTVLHVHATAYNVTKFTGALYLADEAEPRTPDSSSSVEFDNVTGKLVITNKISLHAVGIVSRLCAKKIAEEECVNKMKDVKGGNAFACFPDNMDCARAQNNSNVLSIIASSCKAVQ